MDSRSSKNSLEILESSEAWEEVDGCFEFSHVKVIIREGPQYFYARSYRRAPPTEIDLATLELHRIPTSDIWPCFPQHLTPAPQPLPTDVFVKRSSLLHYGDSLASTSTSKLVLQEAQICEFLTQFPHPNIARYLGCEVENGLITGLCFEKYGCTLYEKIKNAHTIDTAACLRSIEEGMKHLHSLGLVHGDLNPHNVLSRRKSFVITDFDSCTRQGEPIGLKGGTEGWTLDCTTAEFNNDLHGLSKIEQLLYSQRGNPSIPIDS